MGKASRNKDKRFWSKVDIRSENDCWEWLGSLRPDGYGQFYVGPPKRVEGAHRQAYLLVKGPIPEGLFVCHFCDNPPCCNPDHLWLGTNSDNIKDSFIKGRSKPKKGEANPAAKLTQETVDMIRLRAAAGELQKKIAKDLGISTQQVSRIVRGDRW